MTKSIDEIESAEKQIRALQQDVDYTVREYPVEVVVGKYLTGLDDNTNEIFVPEYQRDLIWDDSRQSKFIESLLIGLPIPYIFAADAGNEDETLSGRLEIIDGTQRLRTLASFLLNSLELRGLEKLTALNGFTYRDLPPSRQRRFNRITLRMIELTERADEETRRDMFDRINTGSVRLNDMESRRGRLPGPFVALVKDLAQDNLFRLLAPVSGPAEKRFEREELVARFFAYLDEFEDFGRTEAGKVVSDFVDDYTSRMNAQLEAEGTGGASETRLRREWSNMLEFVRQNYPSGFTKSPNARTTPRVRFEAIGVGSALALRENPNPPGVSQIPNWINGDTFRKETTSDAANNRNRVLSRIKFVRDRLLTA
ncbi:DUF262 domain-containing protein [Microvirga sp. VF16]|uniref:DUF262 domain-containing protein n=1 Tax=Microvirga sp. VF16 TaxID=2807101 RepID=UPI00193D0870|nr:DUF262 domain-containing protein [Microvirga sp. VF16]QRM28705.1 DUF262 domain-containing protein [Microvirga sp. VF16]